MHFQWYPGHMTKAKRMMEENIKLIDLIIELVDARVPLSSRNPEIDNLGKNKSRLILLNKTDLSDERQNDAWMEYFKKKGFFVVKVNARNGNGVKQVNAAVMADFPSPPVCAFRHYINTFLGVYLFIEFLSDDRCLK